MEYKKITSLDNTLIQHINKIKTKKYSKQFGECFLQTQKIIFELIKKGVINTVLLESESEHKFLPNLKNFKGKIFVITKTISKHISDLVSIDGIFAICNIIDVKVPKTNFLVLDNIQDANNFGAIIRSAVAFNFLTVYALDCVYPFLPKTIRASMGYVFDCAIKMISKDEFVKIAKENSLNLIAANLNGVDADSFKKPEHFGLVIGNEGSGISQEIESLCTHNVSIKTQNVESLNAGVSAGILMNLLK